MKLHIDTSLNEKEVSQVIEHLDTYGVPLGIPARSHTNLHLALRDQKGNMRGALIGYMYWSWLYVEFLWVDADLRGGGYGSQLLEKAEQLAIQEGCIGVHLETHDFQAYDFYLAHGYTLVGTIEDLPPGYKRYDLMKKIT